MSRALRIAHVTATFPPYLGGCGNVAYHNALELARRGHEVHVFTGGAANSFEDDSPEVTVHRLRTMFRIGNAPLLKGLGRALDGFDLVHLHYPFYFGGEQVWWSCRNSGRPYVVTYQMDVFFPGPLSFAPPLHHHLVGSRVVGAARLVIASTLDYAANSRLATLPRERLIEIPNGVDTTEFRPGLDVRHLRTRYGLEECTPVVLFVGGLDRPHYFKGIPVLLNALQNVRSAVLLIAGEGDQRPAYQREAQAAGLGDRVRFVGRVRPDELPAHYNLADVSVLPSINRMEAFGLVLIEAMAAGTPVIASRLPGVRSVVDDGVTGVLTNPGDPADLAAGLSKVLDNASLKASMAASAREKAQERYDWRPIAGLLEQAYEQALADPAGDEKDEEIREVPLAISR